MAAPIILVHGAFCGGWAFDAFKAPFEAAGHPCQSPDLPGHGPGEAAAGLSMSAYADFVAQLIAGCAEPPILIGHSLGGLAAAMAAGKAEIAGLILLAPSAPWGVTGSSMEEAASAVGLLSLGAYWTEAVPPDFGLASGYSLDRLPRAAQQAIYERMVPESGRALWETLNWWLDPFMTTQLSRSRIAAPTLAVAGGQDRIHPPATVRQTAASLGAEVMVFDEMSHWLIGEPGYEAVAAACLKWISSSRRAAA